MGGDHNALNSKKYKIICDDTFFLKNNKFIFRGFLYTINIYGIGI